MLTIKRVPTVVSNYQDQEETASENSEAGCGSNCLGNCSLPGMCLAASVVKETLLEVVKCIFYFFRKYIVMISQIYVKQACLLSFGSITG